MKNAEDTKTLLCFMAKSLCCKYEDVVAMVPLPAINSSAIKSGMTTCYRCSSKLASTLLLFCAHTANLRFFAEEL
ncbi:Putative LOC100568865, partial [Caligus rogercresseyi]